MESLAMDEGPARSEGLCDRIRQMTSTERNYFFATCSLSAVLTALVTAIIAHSTFGGNRSYCMSKECTRAAAHIISSMNPSADPCTDFDEFACGGWRYVGGLEDDNWHNRIVKSQIRQAEELLARNNSKTDFEAVKKARRLFQSCMATDILDDLELEPLLELLEKAGLPPKIPNRKNVSDFDLTRTLARIHRTLGVAILLDVQRENSETFMVMMPPIDLYDTPHDDILTEVETYVYGKSKNSSDLFVNSITKWDFMLNRTVNRMEEELKLRGRFFGDTGFESDHSFRISSMRRNRLPASTITQNIYHGIIPDEKHNTLNYEVYMEALLDGKPDVNWSTSNGTLLIINPEYHSLIATRLRSLSAVNIQMIVWTEVIKQFAVHTTTSFRQKLSTGQLALKSQPSRSESCTAQVINLMPVAVDHLLAQVDPLTEAMEQVTVISKEILKSQRVIIQNTKWLKQRTSREILRHLDDLEIVHIHEGKLLQTIADIQVWQAETNFFVSPKIGRLRKDPIASSAYYLSTTNTITVHPTMMRLPFYHLGIEGMNYGAMGFALGHEFGHAVGFIENNYFTLGARSITKVREFTKCIENRMLDFTSKRNVGVDPSILIVEDLSDISGINTALYTFNSIRKRPELYLPGLEKFSHDQLFFLAYANVFCSNGKPPRGSSVFSHRDSGFRILNAASSTPEFAKIWNCPVDSPMNPTHRCTLW